MKSEGTFQTAMPVLRSCLSSLELAAPNGNIRLDENRQAIGTNFVNEVIELEDGTLANELVYIKENVNQTLGMDPEVFAKLGLPSREVPECKLEYN